MFEGAIDRTPFEGREKGVQCGRVVVDVGWFQIALPSIFKSLRPCRWSSMVGQQWQVDIVLGRKLGSSSEFNPPQFVVLSCRRQDNGRGLGAEILFEDIAVMY
jgi:hypothetical protein